LLAFAYRAISRFSLLSAAYSNIKTACLSQCLLVICTVGLIHESQPREHGLDQHLAQLSQFICMYGHVSVLCSICSLLRHICRIFRHYLLVICAAALIPEAPFTRYNLLSNRLSNRFDNRVNVCIHDRPTTGCQTRLTTGLTNGCIAYTAGCQTGCTTGFDNRLCRVNKHPTGCQTGCQTGLTQPV